MSNITEYREYMTKMSQINKFIRLFKCCRISIPSSCSLPFGHNKVKDMRTTRGEQTFDFRYLKVLYGFQSICKKKNVNIWCAVNGITRCICWHLVNVTPNTINADDYFKMWIRMCIRVYLFILNYALLSKTFQHLLLYNMHCYCYYNASQRTHHTMQLKYDF